MPGSLFFSTSILVDVGTEYFHIDSPGEQQKIAILTAMGNEPDLLVLDEPVSSLDPLARRAFLKSLLAIARETDRTILFRHTSHQTLNALPPTSRSCMKARFNGLTNWMSPRNVTKERIKRLRFRSDNHFPISLSIPGAIAVQVDGTVAIASVAATSDAEIDSICSQYNASVEIEDLNLEEVF